MSELDRTLPEMEEPELGGSAKLSFSMVATLNDFNTKAKKDGPVCKIVFEARREALGDDAIEALSNLTGKEVYITGKDVHYRAVQSAKGVEMRAKMDRAAKAEPDAQPKTDELTLQGEIRTIGDFTNPEGDRFTIKPFEGGFIHDGIAAPEGSHLADLEMITEVFPSEGTAREALKIWCVDSRGFTPIAPIGFGMVYEQVASDGTKCLHLVGSDGIQFSNYGCNEDLSAAVSITGLGPCVTAEEAQSQLDTWAIERGSTVYGYIDLSTIAPIAEVAVEEPVGLIAYSDGHGNVLRVVPEITDPESGSTQYWIESRAEDGSITRPQAFSSALTPEELQTTLNAYANMQMWTAIVPVTEEEIDLATAANRTFDLIHSRDGAAERWAILQESGATNEQIEAAIEAESGDPFIDIDEVRAILNIPYPATEEVAEVAESIDGSPVFRDIPGNKFRVKKIITEEGDRFIHCVETANPTGEDPAAFGMDVTRFYEQGIADQQLADWSKSKGYPLVPATPVEAVAEDAPEPAPEVEIELPVEAEPEPIKEDEVAEPVETEDKSDPFNDGSSIGCLYDLVIATIDKGVKPMVELKEEFRTPTSRTGPLTITGTADDFSSVTFLGGKAIPVAELNEQYNAYVPKR